MGIARRIVRTGLHVSSAFVPSSVSPAARVAPRRAIASTHARIAVAAERSDPDDYAEKRMRLLGRDITFFNWQALHYLFDEIFVQSCYAFDPGRANPRIVDAGGNIGMATLWFTMAYPKAQITTIEPDPTTFAVLQKNIWGNGLNHVQLVQAAVSSAAGTIDFIVDAAKPGSLTMSTDAQRNRGQAISVPRMRLSDLIDGPVDLLKIDVEGAEHDALGELASSGALAHIRAISMEYHHNIGGRAERLSSMLALLESQGFVYQVSAPNPSTALDHASAAGFQDVAVLAARAA